MTTAAEVQNLTKKKMEFQFTKTTHKLYTEREVRHTSHRTYCK